MIKKIRDAKSACFIGTKFNYLDPAGELENIFNIFSATYLEGQEEICPDTKREHLQFKIWLKFPRAIKSMIINGKHIDWTPIGIDNRVHYATKEETRKPGTIPFKFGKLALQIQK